MPESTTDEKRLKLISQMVVSTAVLALSFTLVLDKNYGEAYAKWAFGMIGLVSGYWLR